MKRFFFMTIALAAVAVGCTKSGLIESPQTYETPISFEPYTGKSPVSKATVENETSLKAGGFHVTGFIEGADGAIVTAASSTNPTPYYLDKDVVWGTPAGASSETWFYNEAKYWPEGEKLSFVAYGLNVNTGGEGTIFDNIVDASDYKDYAKFTYSVPTVVANQKDLVISPLIVNKDNTSGTIAVQLYHVLSRVGFKVLPLGNAGVNVVIKSVKLKGDFVEGATFDLTEAVSVSDNTVSYKKTPESASTAVSYDLFGNGYTKEAESSTNTHGFVATSVASTSASALPIFYNCDFELGTSYKPGDEEPTSGASDTDRFMMIMPQTIENAEVEVIYHLTDDVERVATIPIGDTTSKEFTFAAGKAYEFVFTISTVAVGFNVEVNTWDPAAGENVETELTPVA